MKTKVYNITNYQLNKLERISRNIHDAVYYEDAEYGYHLVLDALDILNNIVEDVKKGE